MNKEKISGTYNWINSFKSRFWLGYIFIRWRILTIPSKADSEFEVEHLIALFNHIDEDIY